MNQDHDFDLALELGELKGLIRGVCERLDKQNGVVADLAKKVQRHEIFFGKIGVLVTALGFIISTISTLAVSWIKTKFFS